MSSLLSLFKGISRLASSKERLASSKEIVAKSGATALVVCAFLASTSAYSLTPDVVITNSTPNNALQDPIGPKSNALASPDTFADQRKTYRQAQSSLRKGLIKKAKTQMRDLTEYPLYPYLVKDELKRRIRTLPYAEVDVFFNQYGSTVAADQLRRKWLSTLAKKRKWPEYLSYYDDQLNSKTLKCWQIEALHQTGNTGIALDMTSSLWLHGSSLPAQCDRIFSRWEQAGGKTDAIVWQRMVLALEANNYRLAKYISKSAPKVIKEKAKRLLWIHRKPELLANTDNYAERDQYTTHIIAHGLKRLAAKDKQLASKLWVDYRGNTNFSLAQSNAIRDSIARQVIASGDPDALKWLINHDPNAEDSYLLEWRIRLAIKDKQWRNVEKWIGLLPAENYNDERWQYWLARAYENTPGKEAQANRILEQVAKQRNYYGFLAADRLGVTYGFNDTPLNADQVKMQVANNRGILRAREFYELKEFTNARREWNATIQQFDSQQMIAASTIANDWQWHQQAIQTTIKAQQWNDLSIRFPLAHQEKIFNFAEKTQIKPEWIYAITRQESAFAHDAYSSAGARGLMQLLPGTAKQVARNIGVNFRSSDLFKPEKNIKLGSHYLQQLLNQFEGNRILATAAYNAGPHRVNRWLENQTDTVDYDIWIETLPFHETRSYVQNVLAFSVIYGYRLGIETDLIQQHETEIKIDQAE